MSGHYYNHVYSLLPRKRLTITLLREPVARALSHYRHIWRLPGHYFYEKVNQIGNLKAFLQDKDTQRVFSNFQTRMLAVELDVHALISSLDWSRHYVMEEMIELAAIPNISDAELLARAKARLDSFEFVGLTERMEESTRLLDYLFGWWPTDAEPRENITPINRDYGRISPDAIDLLREMNTLDTELYRYAEQRFSAEYTQMVLELLQEPGAFLKRSSGKFPIEVAFDHQLTGTG